MSEQPSSGPDDAPEATTDDAGDVGDVGDVAGGARFRLGYVPGATPGKWARTWRDRLPDVRLELVLLEAADTVAALTERRVDAAIARLPVDPDVLHAIPLYEEVPVVVVGRDHLLAATTDEDVVTVEDLADEVVWLPLDDVLFADGRPVPGRAPTSDDPDAADGLRPATTAEAIAWAATGVGTVVVPMSLARLHHRKDVTHRVLDGGPVAPVGLAWLVDVPDEAAPLVEEIVGIVRGRTANSSRGRGPSQDEGAGTREERRARRREAQREAHREAKASGDAGRRAADAGRRTGRPGANGRSRGRPSGGRPGPRGRR